MEKIKASGLSEIYFTTLKESAKVKHFSQNNKAGVSFCIGYDSVSLMGEIEIIDDINVKKAVWKGGRLEHRLTEDKCHKYCVLKFKTTEFTLYIDNKKKAGMYHE